MISLELYRLRIGAHCARHISATPRVRAVKKTSKVNNYSETACVETSLNYCLTSFCLMIVLLLLMLFLPSFTYFQQLFYNHDIENSLALFECISYLIRWYFKIGLRIFDRSLLATLNSLWSNVRMTLKRIFTRANLTVFHFLFVYLFMLKLLLSGDVELNPGPSYNLVKVVKASLHQANPMFGNTAGTQCACNALFSICWALWKNVGFWYTDDLDYILIKGDELRKSIKLNRYLGMEDLPNNVDVEGNNVTIKNIALITVELKVREQNF